MNILLINQDWFADEFQASGHKTLTVGTRPHLQQQIAYPFQPIKELLASLSGNFRPDCIVIYDESSPLLLTGLPEIDLPVLFYSVDCHHHLDVHKFLAQCFDATLVAQRDYAERFREYGAKAEWMPLWASSYLEASEEKQFGAVFVGTLNRELNPARVDFFEALQKKVPVMVKKGYFAQIFPYSEIVINQLVKDDINFRVFEAMISGAMLLTEDVGNGLDQLFKVNQHLTVYRKNDVDGAAEVIDYYLTHKKECRDIGIAGREQILCAHLPKHRAAQVLGIIETLQKSAAGPRYFPMVPNFVWAGNALSKTDKVLTVRAFEAALRCIKQGLENDEVPHSDLACYAIYACVKFDEMLNVQLGQRLLLELGEKCPRLAVAQIARIWALLQKGERETAASFARQISNCPSEEVFTHIERVLQDMIAVNSPR